MTAFPQCETSRRRPGFSALAASILSAVFLFPAAASATEPGSWEVRGTVVAAHGAPVAGAAVTVRNLAFAKTVQTTSDGGFLVTVPQPRAWGFSVLARDATGNKQASFTPAAGLQLAAPIGPIRLELAEARRLAVTVVDQSSRPVDGASVGATWNFKLVDEVQTDREGQAVLRMPRQAALQFVFAFKAGTGLDYIVFRRPDQPASNPYMRSPTDLSPLELVLSGARSVRVHVVDNQGHGLGGLRVDPWYFSLAKKGEDFNTSGLDTFARTTDASGWARFPLIPPANKGKITFWV